jgi:hypothetical protein
MIDKCKACLCLFNREYVSEITGSIVVTEVDPQGVGTAVFTTDKHCILIKPKHNIVPIWSLSRRNCADGAFFLFDSDKNEVRLHIVELKSIVRFKDWIKALGQIEGMFLVALAVGRLLHMHEVPRVTCYLVLKEDRIRGSELETPSPILLKGQVGGTATFGRKESWDKEVIELPRSANVPYAVSATLVKGWKNDTGIVDFGMV